MLLISLFHAFWMSVWGGTPDTTQKVVVRQVQIIGNFRTKERIIRREMDVKGGDTLTVFQLDSLLEYDRRKILNTNLFLSVELKKKVVVDTTQLPFYTADAKWMGGLTMVDIEVVLKEQWYLLAFPVFELADRNFNEWWYERGRDLSRTIYGVYALHQNLTGNNDRLRLRAEFGFIPRLDIYYSIPYLDKKQRTGLTIGILRITNRSLAYRTNRDKLSFLGSDERTRERIVPYLTLTHRPKFYGYHSFSAQYSMTNVADTIARLNPNYFLGGKSRQRYLQLSYSHFYDRRDRGQYALRGYIYGFYVSKIGVLPSEDVDILEATFNWGQYIPLAKKLYFSYLTELKVATPARQPFLQTRGMGYGGDLVRGYELYVIDGPHYSYLKTNLRYQLLNRTFNLSKFIKLRQFNALPIAIYPNIYADVGYVRNPYPELNNSQLANRPLFGFGVGMDVVTWYNFVGRINYSFNHLGEARPYFAIGREF
ncbi:POTRA domain-containing protein [Runella sp. MFBS21]|uniref:BamA/TamA family outer membrane protein n=1 Tax=Runella sp. MFBS21 TaxID=3034018 RepID=UPI0023F71F79|nr:BamA/TamA family outer membrane protein [Runella sp. MFBS21]MDF7820533.1 POTRA domain-containing protein [Runella sp. MFBS21]